MARAKKKTTPKKKRGTHLTPLMWACVDGDLAEVKRRIAAGADPNEATEQSTDEYQLVHLSFTVLDSGRTALMIASGDMGEANLDIMRALLDAGARVDASGDAGTPLSRAGGTGNVEALRLLLDRGADVNQAAMFTPLFAAASEGHEGAVRFLLERGAKVDAVIWTGDTPLMAVRKAGIATLLLDAGADPNARGRRNTTALLEAIQRPEPVPIVEILLARGADPLANDDEGQTPLALAAALAGAEVTRLLLDAGVKPTAAALLRASELNRLDTVIALLDAGADIESRDEEGTPYLRAARNGYVDLGVVLLARGAVRDPAGAALATKNGRDEFVRMLEGEIVRAEVLPSAVIMICLRAEELYQNEDWAAALAAYGEVPETFRDRIFANVSNSGYCHQQLGHVAASLECFERALVLDADAEQLWRGLCFAYFEAKRWADMTRCALRLTKLMPKNSWCWQQLAIARGEEGDHRGAVTAGKRALALDPKNAYAMFNLANMEKKLGVKGYRARYARAIAIAPELASSLDPEDRDLAQKPKRKKKR